MGFVCWIALVFLFLFEAMRREEVFGIRNKFPNSKFPFSMYVFRNLDITILEIPVIVERYHKEKDLPMLGE